MGPGGFLCHFDSALQDEVGVVAEKAANCCHYLAPNAESHRPSSLPPATQQ